MLRRFARPWIIAHRGILLEMPENTLIGFEGAISQGADFVELDVRQTADGQIVVIHDDTLDRTTDGTGPVETRLLAELQELDAGSWMGPAFAGQRIPTLREVLDLTAGRVGLVIEMKASAATSPGIEAAVVALIREAGRMDDVLIISGICEAIQAVKRLEPRLPTLCFRHASLDDITRSPAPHSDVLFAWPGDITLEMVQEAHSHGCYVLSSTLAESTLDVQQLRRAALMDVDGVFTNEPGRLYALWRGGAPSQ